jgi:hypothetical protein
VAGLCRPHPQLIIPRSRQNSRAHGGHRERPQRDRDEGATPTSRRELVNQDLRFQDEPEPQGRRPTPTCSCSARNKESAATRCSPGIRTADPSLRPSQPHREICPLNPGPEHRSSRRRGGAFQDLTSGLIDAALHAKNLGDVAKNVFLNLIQQILTQTLQKEALPGLEAAGSALLHFIPGFASGTNSAPGGLALVGEKGPELVNLPRGASVAPTFQTLNALNSMKAPRAASVTVIQPFHFHAEGAVMTEDLLMQANSNAAQLAAQAGGRRGLRRSVTSGARATWAT